MIIAVVLLFFAVHIIPYLIDSYSLCQYPGPLLARFSYLWKFQAFLTGRYSEVLRETHLKYGPVVRISPRELSFVTADALAEIYSPRNSGVYKADFYEAFVVSGFRPLIAARDRESHATLRNKLARLFIPKVINDFVPRLKNFVGVMLDKWEANKTFNCIPWTNFLAIDFITALLFDNPFGLVESGQDVVSVPKDMERLDEIVVIPALQTLAERSEVIMIEAMLPWWWRPLVPLVMRKHNKSVHHIFGLVMRMIYHSGPEALTAKLRPDQTIAGPVMGIHFMSLMLAGVETMSSSISPGMYHLAANPSIQERLYDELNRNDKHYLYAFVDEFLRIEPTSGLGLPRVVPPQGFVVAGRALVPGTVIGAPNHASAMNTDVWDDDAEVFRPERWLDGSAKVKASKPFSDGPMGCLGKNLALTELRVIFEMVVRSFRVRLVGSDDQGKPDIHETFNRKITQCVISVEPRT